MGRIVTCEVDGEGSLAGGAASPPGSLRVPSGACHVLAQARAAEAVLARRHLHAGTMVRQHSSTQGPCIRVGIEKIRRTNRVERKSC